MLSTLFRSELVYQCDHTTSLHTLDNGKEISNTLSFHNFTYKSVIVQFLKKILFLFLFYSASVNFSSYSVQVLQIISILIFILFCVQKYFQFLFLFKFSKNFSSYSCSSSHMLILNNKHLINQILF